MDEHVGDGIHPGGILGCVVLRFISLSHMAASGFPTSPQIKWVLASNITLMVSNTRHQMFHSWFGNL